MRILRAVYGVVVAASLLYAVYSAFLGEWPRATFFLVLYHVMWQIGTWIESLMTKARSGGMM